MSATAAAPTLPIKNRSTVTESGGRTPKRGGTTNRSKREEQQQQQPKHKAWADFTPTPWLDYAPTPWSTHGAMPTPYGGMFMGQPASVKEGKKKNHKEGKEDHHATDVPGAYPSTPTPTPKSWGATPTPSNAPSVPPNFGLPGVVPVPPPMMMMPPFGFAAMAQQMAEAAAVAAAAAAAAALNSSAEPSPEPDNRSYGAEAFDSPPWMAMQPGMSFPMAAQLQENQHNLSSKGSAMHGSGKCRPCAWFWKPHGCHSAEDCSYCHLCPEGELKSRKKLKVAAMRMGALTPAKPGTAPGAARTLKLTSLV